MTRSQWLFVCATAVVAVVAYAKADTIMRRLNGGVYRAPSRWTA